MKERDMSMTHNHNLYCNGKPTIVMMNLNLNSIRMCDKKTTSSSGNFCRPWANWDIEFEVGAEKTRFQKLPHDERSNGDGGPPSTLARLRAESNQSSIARNSTKLLGIPPDSNK